ncbi:MAG: polysaccharide deacetylase [Solibacterales bacterium]|nr:polysaccharide deacetylase [Bryobacterales bacterium]|tara:strand:+ start:255132 stop:256076 length:945 start_codon:yes stop_codon:yes gene_type:complete
MPVRVSAVIVLFAVTSVIWSCSHASTAFLPIPDRLVVLTFDDGNKSDLAFVAPLLKQYEFGASFYVTEGLGYHNDVRKERYMRWAEVRRLHEMGFEIGNHTGDHPNMTTLPKAQIRENLELIERRCVEHDIPFPQTFVYPGFHHSLPVVEVLAEKGYTFARRGIRPEYLDRGHGERGRAYDPQVDHPLLIPTTGYVGTYWQFEDLVWTVDQAKNGKIAVLVYHGVPGLEHPWVSAEPEHFVRDMAYLKDQNCTVIAMRDLRKYVDSKKGPISPYEPISFFEKRANSERQVRTTSVPHQCARRVIPDVKNKIVGK